MVDNANPESIKGDRSMSQGFVAQYAAEAAFQHHNIALLLREPQERHSGYQFKLGKTTA